MWYVRGDLHITRHADVLLANNHSGESEDPAKMKVSRMAFGGRLQASCSIREDDARVASSSVRRPLCTKVRPCKPPTVTVMMAEHMTKQLR